jgi:hypothetical protein
MESGEFERNTINHEEKRNCIRADHPLSVLGDLPLSRGDECNDGRDEPQGCEHIHGQPKRQVIPPNKEITAYRTRDNRADVYFSEQSMTFDVSLSKAAREL